VIPGAMALPDSSKVPGTSAGSSAAPNRRIRGASPGPTQATGAATTFRRDAAGQFPPRLTTTRESPSCRSRSDTVPRLDTARSRTVVRVRMNPRAGPACPVVTSHYTSYALENLHTPVLVPERATDCLGESRCRPWNGPRLGSTRPSLQAGAAAVSRCCCCGPRVRCLTERGRENPYVCSCHRSTTCASRGARCSVTGPA